VLSLLVEPVGKKPVAGADVQLKPDTTTDGVTGVASGFSRTSEIRSEEVVLAVDPISGQYALLIGGVPLTAGLSARRRWGTKADGASGSGPQRIVAPMPGKVVRVLARRGDAVQQRQAVVVVEAMKMENELRTAQAGTVTELLVREGQSVEAGALLAVVTPGSDAGL
jgi:biotin carboxyl carrier protein